MNALDQKKSEHPTRTDTSSWEGRSPRAGAFGRLAVSGMVDFYVCITLIKLGEAYDNLDNTRDCDSFRCGSHGLGRGGGLCSRYRTVCRTAQPGCPEECSDARAQSGQWGLQSRHVGHGRESRWTGMRDRKSTRLNSSHVAISYAVFCLKKKKKTKRLIQGNIREERQFGRPGNETDNDRGKSECGHSAM